MIIHLFHIPTLAANIPLSTAQELLDIEEKNNAANIRVNHRLHEFIYGRYCLKLALAKHLNVPAKSLTLLKRPQGKLYLQDNPIFFNLTHSGEYLAFCISSDGEIGIDIEHVQKRTANIIGVAKRYFTPAEYQAIQRCEGREQYALFYKVWTLKEAAFKATGAGISAGLERINALEISPQQPQMLHLAKSQHVLWFNHWLNPLGFEDIFLAIALEPTHLSSAAPVFELSNDL
ncbi:4'-phosphopantetheinyl transferase family protein [Marinagarivorans algicola]|uniref:4'-phosphopantetheinyl transferase family protein n=1 Tax=Marinagarivorans algicola TaxID=1513270 RepID=UPI003735E0E2